MTAGIFVMLIIVNIILIGAFSHLLYSTRKKATDQDLRKLRDNKNYRIFIIILLTITVLAALGSMVGVYSSRSVIKNAVQPSINRAVNTYKNIDARATRAYNAAMNVPAGRPANSVELSRMPVRS